MSPTRPAPPPLPPLVSTTRAAAALGVSVSTVKRWVDEGVLPAAKTAGGHRKVATADVLALARRGALPPADAARLARGGRGRTPPPAGSPAALADALVRGDRDAVRAAVVGGFRAGVGIEALADDLIGPALREIGRAWEQGRIDVLHEHRASQVCVAAVHEVLAELAVRPGGRLPVAVGAAAPQDPSSLPTLLAQAVLLEAGWNAVNLGPDTPFASLERAVAELRPRLVWVSVTHLADADRFVAEYRRFYDAADRAGVAVALGGGGLSEAVRARVTYAAYGDGLRHLAAFARTLHAPPRPPRRGRPKKAPPTDG